MAKKVGRAVDKFDRLYNAMVADGVIDKSEAHALVKYHNELQRLSRDELRSRLHQYGHVDYGNGLSAEKIGVPPLTDTSTDDDFSGHNLPALDRITWRPSQKQRFFMITGPSIIVTALHLLGVF